MRKDQLKNLRSIKGKLSKASKQERINMLEYLLKRCTWDDLPIISCRYSDPLLKLISDMRKDGKI